MAFQKTGVEFVAKGIRKYLKSFSNANKAVKKHNDELNSLADAVSNMSKSFGDVGVGKFVAEIAEGIAVSEGFVATLGKIGTALGVAALAITAAIAGFKLVIGVIKTVIGVVASLVKGIFNLAKGALRLLGKVLKFVLSPLRKFRDALGRMLEIAGGILIRDSIRGLTRLIRDMQKAVLEAASDFEMLEVRMQNVIARSIRLSDSTISIADGFRMAVKPAKDLMNWVQKMSLIAPVDPEAITNTLTYAATLDMGIEKAKEITEATLEFTTAMGFQSEVTERIITNFVQMQRQGKITGREITDLGRGAMVPTTDILKDMADRLGIATEDWDKFLDTVASGKVPVKEFLTSFMNVVKRDFPDAFERMSNTLQGSIQRLKNWAKTVVGFKMLGPITAEVGKMIGSMVEKLSLPRNIAKAEELGKLIKKSFIALKEPVKDLIDSLKGLAEAFGLPLDPAKALAKIIVNLAAFMKVSVERVTRLINQLTDNMGQEFSQTAKNARTWGSNIVVQLANGMAEAISAVLQVIAQIGKVISSWLKPGSPPKIAPNLDKWGAQAMTEYMRGWLQGDFSVFEEISGIISGYIRSLNIDERGIVPSILGSRGALAQAIRQMKSLGKVTRDMINSVVNSMPNATEAFRRYIRATLELANAQRKVNRINSKYNKILDELNAKLRHGAEEVEEKNKLEKINKALATGRLTEDEKARLEAEKRDILITQEIRSVEEKRDAELSAATAKMKALEEEKSAAEALIKVQTDQNNLLNEQKDLLESLAETMKDVAGSMAESASQIDDAVRELFGGLDGLNERMYSLYQFGEKGFNFGDMFSEAEETINGVFDAIATRFGELDSDIQSVREAWQGIFTGKAVGKDANMPSGYEPPKAKSGIEVFIEDVKTLIDETKTLISNINEVYTNVKPIIKEAAELFKLLNDMRKLGTPMGMVKAALGLGETAGVALGGEEGGYFTAIITGLKNLTTELNIFSGEGKESPLDKFVGAWSLARTNVVEEVEALSEELIGDSIIPDMMDDIIDEVEKKLGVKEGVAYLFRKYLLGGDNSVMYYMKKLKTDALDVAGEFMDKIVNVIETGVAKMIAAFQNAWYSIVGNSIIPNMMSDIDAEITFGLDKNIQDISSWAQQVASTFQGMADYNTTTTSQPAVTNNSTTNVTVNANYAQQQSPATVRLDVMAALQAVKP